MKAFLLMALSDIICPSTCQRVSVTMLPTIAIVENAQKYDWCTFLLDHLMYSLR